jgi:cobalt-zinc-cadmium efflux system outer membrane protein
VPRAVLGIACLGARSGIAAAGYQHAAARHDARSGRQPDPGRQARARIEQQQGLAVQAGLYPNPQQNSGNPNQLGGANSLYSVGIQQEIVRAGKIPLNVAAAEQAVRQANLDLIRQQFDAVTAVRQQFFLLLAIQRRLATLQDLQKIAQQSLDITVKLRQAEQATETDMLLLQIELRRIEASLRSATFTTTAAAQQLAALIGLPDLKIERALGDLSVKLPDFNDPQVRSELLTRSTLIESARAESARNEFLLRRAEAEPTPNLILNSGYQWTVNQPHSQALIGTYFNIPIWDRNQGNIRAAGANVRQAMAQLNSVENDLLRQLADALGRYHAAQVTVSVYQQGILPDAQRTYELVQKGLEGGQFDLLRILQSQRSVIEANLDYISALQDRLSAAATIAGLLQLKQFP